jgi:hypothetical protein
MEAGVKNSSSTELDALALAGSSTSSLDSSLGSYHIILSVGFFFGSISRQFSSFGERLTADNCARSTDTGTNPRGANVCL